MHEWFVEMIKICTSSCNHSLSIEHNNVLEDLITWFSGFGSGDISYKVGDTCGCRSCTNEEVFLLVKWKNTLDTWSCGNSSCSNRCCTFNIIVEAVAPPAEVVKKVESDFHFKVFELNKAVWSINILNCIDEFFNKC